jgi:hypothetical protein
VVVGNQFFTLSRVDSSDQDNLASQSNDPLSAALQTFSFSDSTSYPDFTRRYFEAIREQINESEIFGVFPIDDALVEALKEVESNVVVQIGGRSISVPPIVLRLPNRSSVGIDISVVQLLQEMYEQQ